MLMKHIFFLLSISIIIATSCGQSSKKEVQFPQYIQNPSGFELHRGVNISHWLSQTGSWVHRTSYFTEHDVEFLHSMGYDHIRLPLDEEVLFDEQGNCIDSAFTSVTNAIDWCIKRDMRVIVDLHILRSHHFNSRNNEGAMTLWTDTIAQNHVLNVWDSISNRLHTYSNAMVAYECMNEPVAPEHEMWNKLVERMIAKIRSLEPDRVIMLGSNRWQKPHTFPYLRVPKNDKNIILTVHTYHPYFVTHYQAFWSAAKFYKGPVQYPGYPITPEDYKTYVDTTNAPLVSRIHEEKSLEYFDKQKLQEILQPAIDKAKEYGLQLYCSEFGCLPNIPRDMRLRYFQDITDVFRQNNISYSSWDYKGHFGIVTYDNENRKPTYIDTTLIKLLVK